MTKTYYVVSYILGWYFTKTDGSEGTDTLAEAKQYTISELLTNKFASWLNNSGYSPPKIIKVVETTENGKKVKLNQTRVDLAKPVVLYDRVEKKFLWHGSVMTSDISKAQVFPDGSDAIHHAVTWSKYTYLHLLNVTDVPKVTTILTTLE